MWSSRAITGRNLSLTAAGGNVTIGGDMNVIDHRQRPMTLPWQK
jgi:hypothetical protein